MAPGAMAGAGQAGISQVKTGLEMLQKALPGLPMGSEIHGAILKAVTDISKHMDQGADDNSGMVQQLAAAARNAQSNPNQAAMGRMFPPPGGGAPPAPGAM